MPDSGADVRRYLGLVRTERPDALDALVGRVDALRSEFARAAETHPDGCIDALAHLGKRRLLASTTLGARNVAERIAWDHANRSLHDRIASDAGSWRVVDLIALNAAVTGTPGALRDVPIYGPPAPYLAPSSIASELEALLAYGRTSQDPALVVAATFYVSLVTIHPFLDGNGRTARLSADGILLAHGYLPLCFHSPIAAHVAQQEGGPPRDPVRSIARTLAAVAESYAIVRSRLFKE